MLSASHAIALALALVIGGAFLFIANEELSPAPPRLDAGHQSLRRLSLSLDPRSVEPRVPGEPAAVQSDASSNYPGARRRRLADGCHHVFLDLGANIGVHTRFLYEPERYPLAVAAKSIFDERFGTNRDNRDFCAFGFEPNPQHAARHEELAAAYARMGWRYTFLQAGVSDEDGSITFYRNAHRASEKKTELGFSVLDRDGKGSATSRAVVVPTVRLSAWLEDEVGNRELPAQVYGSYAGGPTVVAKLDVESYEYAVLPDLLFTGSLCRNVNFMFAELHDWKGPVDYEASQTNGRGGLHMASMKEAKEKMRGAIEYLHSVKDCRTTFSELDDEAYARDGVPLP